VSARFHLTGQCEVVNLSNIWYGTLGGGKRVGLCHTVDMPR